MCVCVRACLRACVCAYNELYVIVLFKCDRIDEDYEGENLNVCSHFDYAATVHSGIRLSYSSSFLSQQ